MLSDAISSRGEILEQCQLYCRVDDGLVKHGGKRERRHRGRFVYIPNLVAVNDDDQTTNVLQLEADEPPAKLPVTMALLEYLRLLILLAAMLPSPPFVQVPINPLPSINPQSHPLMATS